MSDDPTLSKILTELAPEDNLGVLLMAQMGGTPQEIQIILQTTRFDQEKDGLLATGQYIVRAIGVVEQRLSLGLFNNIAFSQENSILHRYNEKYVQVYFKGNTENVDSLMLELHQIYMQMYGLSRNLGEEINRSRPLETLLKGDYGMLGEMALPFAEKVKTLFQRYGMHVSFIESEDERPPIKYQVLAMDDSYLVAQMFSADPMGLKKTN